MSNSRREDHIIFVVVYTILIIAAFLILTPVNAQTIEQRIVASAKRHHVDPTLALAIAEVESGLDSSKIGTLGEVGLFQLRPEYHAVQTGNVQWNIDVAMKYLAKLKTQCRAYGDAYFVCYNYGTARKLKYPRLFPYYKKVKIAQERRQMNVASRD